DSAARGGLIGLSSTHSRAEVARAILEGTCCAVRDCLEFTAMVPTELRLCGGGAASQFWCQLLADVTGVPTSRSTDAEVGAKGALIAALVATGQEPDTASASKRLVRRQLTFEPDPAVVVRYHDLYADFVATREALAPQWPRLARAGARRSGDGGQRGPPSCAPCARPPGDRPAPPRACAQPSRS